MDNIPWGPHPRPGYRLKKLEVTNWGTFDSSTGKVFSLAPEGRTALLVGQNGSGKSTLVDALLTLLVQPGIRNYNVAAGAKKRERDERTYIRGACGRSSHEELGSVTDYLRPADNHYSVLLACFQREDTGDAFTVAQVLYITSAGEVDKTYAFCPQERSIATDLAGLTRSERIRKQLMQRGFKATASYTEYLPWIAQVTHMRPKAMDVFNQTVAVKDIQSLNHFIRDHMLESHPWRGRIEGLLAHFSQLSQAHQSLVKARRQVDLLAPIQQAATTLQTLSTEMAECQRQLDAVDSFFREQMIVWLQPRLDRNTSTIAQSKRRKLELQVEIDALDETQRFLKNEIEKTGGQRLRQLPLLLETQQAILSAKKRERQRLWGALSVVGVQPPDNRLDFEQLPSTLENVRQQLIGQSSNLSQQRLTLARELTDMRGAIAEEQQRTKWLQDQPGNLPHGLSEIRTAMIRELQLEESDLVFVCELISVAESESDWQPAIELVLKRFSMSLLVSEQHYAAVSSYVERHSLVDARGRGQRLVYFRVPKRSANEQPDREHRDSLLRKLVLRDQHPLSQWLASELAKRFDYRCCETLEQFQRAPGLAITRQRHVKFGTLQHEKDDRPQAVDPKRFVLGWDNAQRLTELQESLANHRHAEHTFEESIERLELESKLLSKKLAAIDTALAIPDFDLIDTQRHLNEISALETERAAIEDSNDAVRLLRVRLDEAISRRSVAQQERDTQVAEESQLARESEDGAYLLQRHAAILAIRETEGKLGQHRIEFDTLAALLAEKIPRVELLTDFSEYQTDASRDLQQRLNHLGEQAEPMRTEVIRSMQKFLSENPEARDDLQADLHYLSGFLGLLERLRKEDLPRHELRFRERLNEKVVQEIGLFHAALQCERLDILNKIELLNTSLEQLEYQPGTFMRLEPRAVSDREIRDFQSLLRDCLSDSFDGNQAADETRFSRIERLIRSLRDEERWRDKVTDVRRWFDFTARELDAVSGQERSCYEDSSGQSGGEKAKLAFTILVAAIAYQFDIDPTQPDDNRLHFVVVDEMFSKVDDRYAEYALQLFEKFGLQLLIVAPLDAKARVTEPYVGCYLHTVKDDKTRMSEVFSLTATEYEHSLGANSKQRRELTPLKPR